MALRQFSRHPLVPLFSLDNAFSADELRQYTWRSVLDREPIGSPPALAMVELKIDGNAFARV